MKRLEYIQRQWNDILLYAIALNCAFNVHFLCTFICKVHTAGEQKSYRMNERKKIISNRYTLKRTYRFQIRLKIQPFSNLPLHSLGLIQLFIPLSSLLLSFQFSVSMSSSSTLFFKLLRFVSSLWHSHCIFLSLTFMFLSFSSTFDAGAVATTEERRMRVESV